MCNWCHFRYFLYFLYRQRHRQRQRQISWVWGVVVLLAPLQISFLWASLFVFAAEPLGRENVRCKMRGGLWKAPDKTIQSSFLVFGTIGKCLHISANSKNHSIFSLGSIVDVNIIFQWRCVFLLSTAKTRTTKRWWRGQCRRMVSSLALRW